MQIIKGLMMMFLKWSRKDAKTQSEKTIVCKI